MAMVIQHSLSPHFDIYYIKTLNFVSNGVRKPGAKNFSLMKNVSKINLHILDEAGWWRLLLEGFKNKRQNQKRTNGETNE